MFGMLRVGAGTPPEGPLMEWIPGGPFFGMPFLHKVSVQGWLEGLLAGCLVQAADHGFRRRFGEDRSELFDALGDPATATFKGPSRLGVMAATVCGAYATGNNVVLRRVVKTDEGRTGLSRGVSPSVESGFQPR